MAQYTKACIYAPGSVQCAVKKEALKNATPGGTCGPQLPMNAVLLQGCGIYEHITLKPKKLQ